jgi:hypothetical protein
MLFIYGQAQQMPSAIGAACGYPSMSQSAYGSQLGKRLWRVAKAFAVVPTTKMPCSQPSDQPSNQHCYFNSQDTESIQLDRQLDTQLES